MAGEGQEGFPQSPMSAERVDQSPTLGQEPEVQQKQSRISKLLGVLRQFVTGTANDIASGRVHRTLNPTTRPEAYPTPERSSQQNASDSSKP